jgi:hypothetical protein
LKNGKAAQKMKTRMAAMQHNSQTSPRSLEGFAGKLESVAVTMFQLFAVRRQPEYGQEA